MDISCKKILTEVFLNKVRKYISDGKFNFIPRRENMNGLSALKLTMHNARDIIANELKVENYVSGPSEDKGQVVNGSTSQSKKREGNVWVFAKDINGVQVYIKLKIEEDLCVVKCLSFHPAENRMKLPYSR